MLFDAVKTRLEARVPALNHRVEAAAGLSTLIARGGVPDVELAAYLTPLGMVPRGAASVSAGSYVQSVRDSIGVVLFARAGSRTGDDALDDIEGLLTSVIGALAGWAPSGQSGVFTFARSRLLSCSAGLLIYQIDFEIDDQLRIAT
ncbi:MAG: hypothetical protein AAGM84_05605 [Pseudomonadota bacterium]